MEPIKSKTPETISGPLPPPPLEKKVSEKKEEKTIEINAFPQKLNKIEEKNITSEENLNIKEENKTIEKKEEEAPVKMLDEPFTMLLMGTDIILDSYNADTLMVLSVNPKTLKVTMLSIPRDTYATIACTGGKHKINASGWYGKYP